MLINFVHPIFSPEIECSSISSEGYEVTNLGSADTHLSQKGFLAERFISGPVTITVKFTCPISIKYIIIWSKVSNQKSLGFELSSCSDSNDARRFASSVIKNDAEGIIFYKEGYELNLNKHSPEIKLFCRGTFSRSKHYENTGAIQIKIFKSHYVPAVKKIEIWGEPYHSCDSKTKRRVFDMWYELQRPQNTEKLVHNESSNAEHACVSLINKETLPEEFYDEITHEIMTLPMILPSGKIVDYRTLEKFQTEEAKWGRLPSDPFTGLLFTENRKPVVAATLKSQIDYYLLKNSDSEQVKTLPRRLGLKNENFSQLDFRISRIVDEKNSHKRKICSIESEEESSSSTKNLKICDSEDRSHIFKISSVDDVNLKTMLEKTLHNLPSFLNDRKVKKEDFVVCSRCCGTNQLYRLPCIHIFCKVCLKVNENNCNRCKIKFSFAQVDKIHIVKSRDAL